MNPSSVGKSNRILSKNTTLAGMLTVALAIPMAASAGQNATAKGAAVEPVKTLLLVREWDPGSGRLVGWLPMHQVTMELEALDKSHREHFTRDDAVKIAWPRHPDRSPETGEMSVSSPSRSFGGQSWVLARSTPNLVIIAKRYYLIRKIIFGEVQHVLTPRQSSAGFVHSNSNW